MGVGIKGIKIRDVDKEVALFWGTECNEDYYASPVKKPEGKMTFEQEFEYIRNRTTSNWFDVLAWQIEKSKGEITDWDGAFNSLIDGCLKLDYAKKHNITREQMVEVYQPYANLVEHFKSLGWVPFYEHN